MIAFYMPIRDSLSSDRQRRTRVSLIALFTLALFASACATAQTVTPGSFFVPQATILCRQIVVTPSDSADVMFDFTDGRDSLGQRSALAAFDSAGRPLYMILFLDSTNRTGRPEIFAVRFYPVEKGGRIPTPKSGGIQPSNVPRRDSLENKGAGGDMTRSEIQEARRLAEWYWAHRCKGS